MYIIYQMPNQVFFEKNCRLPYNITFSLPSSNFYPLLFLFYDIVCQFSLSVSFGKINKVIFDSHSLLCRGY